MTWHLASKFLFPTSVKQSNRTSSFQATFNSQMSKAGFVLSHHLYGFIWFFHWGNPPRPCAKMFWWMSWNSGWAFLGHRNKVHNVIWGQSFTSRLTSCPRNRKISIFLTLTFTCQTSTLYQLWYRHAIQTSPRKVSKWCQTSHRKRSLSSPCRTPTTKLRIMMALECHGSVDAKKGISFVNLQSFMSALHSILQLYPCIYSYVMKVQLICQIQWVGTTSRHWVK